MFSTTSAYALRALAHLAQVPGGIYVLGRDLAVAANIPANYLSKILLALRNAGLIATARGSGGGYRLVKPASAITLNEVVALFDRSPVDSRCVLESGRACSDNHPCTAHDRWCVVRDAYAGFLESTVLHEIAWRGQGAASRRPKRRSVDRAKQRGGTRL